MNRQQRYREALDHAMSVIRSQFYRVGPRGTLGGWHGATRKQARKVARMMARDSMRGVA